MKDSPLIRLISLYYSASIYVGMAGAVLGPSLLKLIDQTDSTLTDLSMIFPARAGSYLVGSWLAGSLFDKYRGHRLLALGLLVMGITLGLVPALAEPAPLFLMIMGMGIAMGLVDVGCSSLLFRIQGINLGPAMNGLHFFYGLGSFLAPLILAGSFLINDQIQWGYWGLGLFSVLVLVQLIRLAEPGDYQKEQPSSRAGNSGKVSRQSVLIPLIMLFFFAFVGVEVGYGDWLSTYSITSGLAAEKAAVLLTSLYWGAFTAGRLVSIPLAGRLKAGTLLSANLGGAVIGLGLVFLFPANISLLWVGTLVLGFSVSSIFPTMLTYAESLMGMTGRITSRFFVSGSVGSIVVPWIIGRYIADTGPVVIIRVLFLILLLAVAAFGFLSRTAKNHQSGNPRVV